MDETTVQKKTLKERIVGGIRMWLFILYTRLGLYNRLRVQERMMAHHVGYLSGHVSDIDRMYAEEHNLKPLSGITLWMMEPIIELEKLLRQNMFRQSMSEYLGEEW